ncbi:hypothetical protein CLHUN_21640 [Ruminiclostridium hungatei]|uniref:DUF5714 domain-containing protein n=1 Tax=Ruminiclostridium hungatei TaxID=48256 RepID=A0A1V4SL22_RUMHU|nr:DUF5714 domain-containing protein [Ruminiclostridium hungatei]OPX43921.1 hypothetical protein CLHUN_21640 [Ruminiclostridium hungatei]
MSFGLCSICNDEIIYKEDYFSAKCVNCGKKEESYIICSNGHYLCKECAAKEVMDKLYEILPLIDLKNPLDVAEKIIGKCGISGHTPHPITAAAFLLAIKNTTNHITMDDVLEGVSRSYEIPGGWCGYYGACGSAIALGVCFSVLLNATPTADKERSIANIVTARGLLEVADMGGPYCCVGSIRAVLEKGIELAKSNLGVVFPEKQINHKKCWAASFQPNCKKERCRFYDLEALQKEA